MMNFSPTTLPNAMTPTLSAVLLDKASLLAPHLVLQQQPEQHRSLRTEGVAGRKEDVCPGLEELLGIRDNIMNNRAATADEFMLCKCRSDGPKVSINCLFPTVCENDQTNDEAANEMECASLTLSFDFDGHSRLDAGACIDYGEGPIEETCMVLEFTLAEHCLVLNDQCHATYGGQSCQRCDVDTTAFCMSMDCTEWNEAVVTEGCQPLGITQGDLDPSKYLPKFDHRKETSNVKERDDPMIEEEPPIGASGASMVSFDARLALSNSFIFLFNLMRHYIL